MTLHDAIARFWRYDLTDDFDRDVARALRAIVERLEPERSRMPDYARLMGMDDMPHDYSIAEPAPPCETEPCDWLAECDAAYHRALSNIWTDMGKLAMDEWRTKYAELLIASAKEVEALRAKLNSEYGRASDELKAKLEQTTASLIEECDETMSLRTKLAKCEQERDAANAKAARTAESSSDWLAECAAAMRRWHNMRRW